MADTDVPGVEKQMEGKLVRYYHKLRNNLPVFVAAVLACGAVIWLTFNLEALGKNIPQTNIPLDYLVGLTWALLLAILLFLWPVRERKQLLIIWSIKVLMTCVIMLFYEANYAVLDAYSYFSYGTQGKFIGETIPLLSGTDFVYWVTAGLSLLTGGSYRALVVIYSFFGLIGIWLIYRSVVLYFNYRDTTLLYLLGLFPSLLFWGSILGKDPLQLLFIGIYSYGAAGWLRHGKIGSLFIAILGIGLVGLVRPWWVLITVIPLLMVSAFTSTRLKRFACFVLLLLLVAGAAIAFVNYSHITSVADVVGFVDSWSKNMSIGGSAQPMPEFHSLSDMLVYWPWGTFTALFRPLPWDAHNLFAVFSGAENLILLIFFIAALFHFRLKYLKSPFILWIVLIILVWAMIYAFISSPNLGAAVRFKATMLPYLLIFIWIFAFPKVRERLKR